jgi:phage shock protein PspC (stress-responsive transcriptional regulator)
MKRFNRITQEGMIGGVCAGVAHYFNIDVTLVRIVWAALALSGLGIGFYLIIWLIAPDEFDF